MSVFRLPRPVIHDQDIFYHGIGPSIENARKADILFVGHSKVELGMDWRSLEEFGARYGIKIFNMALPGERSGSIFLAIIKKFDLRPRILVVSPSSDCDQGMAFFTDPQTPMAKTAMSQGWFRRSTAVFWYQCPSANQKRAPHAPSHSCRQDALPH